KQGADVGPVHVGVGEDDDLVVPESLDVEVARGLHTAAQCSDDRAQLFVVQDLLKTRTLDVEHLASKREDGLESAVPGSLQGSSGAITLADDQLAVCWVLGLAICQLSGEAEWVLIVL